MRFGLLPGEDRGRDGLPVEVGTWLMPVQQAIDRAQAEAQRDANRR